MRVCMGFFYWVVHFFLLFEWVGVGCCFGQVFL